jgi:hypothetical protein
MYRIIYLSSAVKQFSEEEISLLLIQSRKYNAEHNITGVLLHIEGDFLQVIEGEKKIVKQLFEKINLDPRHKGVICVFDDAIKERNFTDWSMGFCALEYENLRHISGYETFKRSDLFESTDKTASVFLELFIKSNKKELVFL